MAETKHPFQAMVDGWSEDMARERARTGMTLGGAITALEALPQDAPVEGLEPLGSYRGYYRDLAFGSCGDRTHDRRGLYGDYDRETYEDIPDSRAPDDAVTPCPSDYETVADVLADCRSALGACFMGYKGGDFWMTAATPLWVAPYGVSTQDRLMAFVLGDDGVVRPVTRVEDDD